RIPAAESPRPWTRMTVSLASAGRGPWCRTGWFACGSGSTSPLTVLVDLRQPERERTDDRQERAHVIHEEDARVIRKVTERGSSDACSPERDAEEQPGDHADPTGHELLRVDH